MSNTQDLRTVLRYAESKGWSVTHAGSGHMRVTALNGQSIVVPKTPSDYRSFANSVADLRRMGLDLPRKAPKPKRKTLDPRRAEILSELQVDLTVEAWPFVTQILGQWRSALWFDEDGSPLNDQTRGGPTDEEMLQCVLLHHLDGSLGIADDPNAAYSFTYDIRQMATLPTGKKRRVMFDAWRLWSECFPRPDICTCGATFTNREDGPFALAFHLVAMHEKGDADHAPASTGLSLWTDPDEITRLMNDPVLDEVQAMQVANKNLTAQLSDLRYKHSQLIDTIRKAIS